MSSSSSFITSKSLTFKYTYLLGAIKTSSMHSSNYSSSFSNFYFLPVAMSEALASDVVIRSGPLLSSFFMFCVV